MSRGEGINYSRELTQGPRNGQRSDNVSLRTVDGRVRVIREPTSVLARHRRLNGVQGRPNMERVLPYEDSRGTILTPVPDDFRYSPAIHRLVDNRAEGRRIIEHHEGIIANDVSPRLRQQEHRDTASAIATELGLITTNINTLSSLNANMLRGVRNEHDDYNTYAAYVSINNSLITIRSYATRIPRELERAINDLFYDLGIES